MRGPEMMTISSQRRGQNITVWRGFHKIEEMGGSVKYRYGSNAQWELSFFFGFTNNAF